MILPDTNLLLYAVDEYSPHHRVASRWFQATLSGTESVAFAWVALLAFLRLSTLPAVFRSPLTADQALGAIEQWLTQPSAAVVHPSDRHPAILRSLLEATGTAGNLVADAHLAALALEHGAVVATADHDFERFPGVRVVYPLSGA